MVKSTFCRLLLIILFSAPINDCLTQPVSYRDIFGDSWNKAEAFEKANRSWMEPLLVANKISYPVAISIVFPELVRYSALSDKMEVTLLKTLYVNLGEDYANFSIGQFQMKPSFAGSIREKVSEVLTGGSDIVFKSSSEYADIKDFRKSIVSDLEKPESQIRYLIAFIKLCENKFHLEGKDEKSIVRFLSTAYNSGFSKTGAEIENMTGRKFFSAGPFSSRLYCYSDISVYWFEQHK